MQTFVSGPGVAIESIIADDALQLLDGESAHALFSVDGGGVERRRVQVISRRGDHAKVALPDGRTMVVHTDSLTADRTLAPPSDAEKYGADVARVMSETGMDPVQAYHHLRGREALRRRLSRPGASDMRSAMRSISAPPPLLLGASACASAT